MPKLSIDPHFEGFCFWYYCKLHLLIFTVGHLYVFSVQGEDDAHEVTVGSVVTLRVKLVRNSLLDLIKRAEEMNEIKEKVIC